MKAAIYARLSSSDDAENLMQQIARGRAYAQERGWEVVVEYVEPKQSGFKETVAGRPQFKKLVAAIEAGQVDVVVVRHTDRLYRDAAKALAFSQLCKVATYSQGIDTTQGQRLPFGMAALLAEEESRVKSDRQKAFRARAAEAGRPRIGGNRAYGFEPDNITPRRSERAVIRKSARMVAGGASLRSVVKFWKESGILNSKGAPVRQNVIRHVLLQAERHGVDTAVARRVRAILEDPSRRHNGQGANRRRFLLNGMVYCAECGAKMYSRYLTRSKIPYYRCSAPDGGCGSTSIQAEKLELFVWHEVQFERVVGSGEALQRDDLSGREAELQEALAVEEARAANKRRDYAEDLIDARTLKEAISLIDGRITKLRRDLADIVRQEVVPLEWYKSMTYLPEFDAGRFLIETAIERVTVRKTDRNPRVEADDRTRVTWQPGHGLPTDLTDRGELIKVAKGLRFINRAMQQQLGLDQTRSRQKPGSTD